MDRTICPACENNKRQGRCEEVGKVVTRKGPYGDFLGCSSFPKCKWSAATNEERDRRNQFKLMRNACWDMPRPY